MKQRIQTIVFPSITKGGFMGGNGALIHHADPAIRP